MNEDLRILNERVSVRSYKQEQITKEELDAVLEAGKNAPTGMNRQCPVFIAVQDKKVRDQLSALNASSSVTSNLCSSSCIISSTDVCLTIAS